MDIDLSQFRESFLAECAEHIGQIEAGLLELEAGHAEPQRLDAIFRAAHSVKGAAGTFGWTAIVRLTHGLEDLFDRMRGGRLAVSPALVHLLLACVDQVKGIMTHRDDGENFASQLSAGSIELLEQMERLGGPQQAQFGVHVADPEYEFEIVFRPSARCFDKGIDPLAALEELADFGMISRCELDVDALPPLEQMDPLTCYVGWKVKLKTSLDESEVRTAFSLIDADATLTCTAVSREVSAASEPAAAVAIVTPVERRASERRGGPQSIRVAAAKVDQLVDLAGELVIAYSMANEVLANFTPESLPRLKEAMAALERNTRELQERVMSVRMMPASSIFQRFPRLVHDTAATTGKQIAIEVSGEETELDKTIAEQLLDPLTHLIRNSADHGIETPEVRAAAGKPVRGTITLRAFHQSGQVVIEVADDGRGLDVDRIRSKAISRGLAAADTQLSESEWQQFIFSAGFSTKDEVSDLSGRGVGMDVVKRNVEALSGTIRIESTPGKGTAVRLYLPLTLAIVDGLLLRVGAQSFVLPLGAVVESIRPKPAQMIRMGANTAVVVRSETLPLLPLSRLFHIPGAMSDPSKAIVIIVETGARRMALLADEIAGHQRFVIKSVEKNFRRVEGAFGATILGDGSVALIIDVSGLWEMHESRGAREAA